MSSDNLRLRLIAALVLKRILDEKNRMTFKRYCEETFLPDIRQRCSENTIYNYRLQLEKRIYPDIGQLEMQLSISLSESYAAALGYKDTTPALR